MASIKGPSSSEQNYDGSQLRIAIVHARWNKVVIDALVNGAIEKLTEKGVKSNNIVVQSVPGSFELPLACSKVVAAAHVQAGANVTNLLEGLNFSPALKGGSRSGTPAPPSAGQGSSQPFDAVIAIGVLIKGKTMHFEYISDAVSHALMRLQMESGVPVIFGLLTALTDEQALERAGLGTGESKGHNHGEDWALAAIEMGSQAKKWGEDKPFMVGADPRTLKKPRAYSQTESSVNKMLSALDGSSDGSVACSTRDVQACGHALAWDRSARYSTDLASCAFLGKDMVITIADMVLPCASERYYELRKLLIDDQNHP